MVHAQLYRVAMSKSEAIAELQKNAGSQFDAAIVDVFIRKVVNALPETM